MRSPTFYSPVDTSLVKTAFADNFKRAETQRSELFTKITAKEESREYVKKTYHRNTAPFNATSEAVGAHLLRTVFTSNFTPKDRVLELDSFVDNEASPQTIYSTHLISKKVAFTPMNNHDKEETDAKKATRAARERFYKTLSTEGIERDKLLRDLAKLLMSVFCFEETDLHPGNWGLDENGNIVKIDHDRMFSSLSDSFIKGGVILGGEKIWDALHLNSWPNLAYTAEQAFGIISEDDINNPFSFTDIKPVNDPLIFLRTNQNLPHLKKLAEDPVFVQWKFFYLTKYLLLLTPDRVQRIIADHSIATQDKCEENQQALFDCIMQRKEKIKQTLMRMKNYQDFLATLSPEMMRELENEINESNMEFSDKDGTPKKHKKHHTIDINEVTNSLAALKKEVNKAIQADTIEKQKQRQYNLEIKRALRALNVVDLLQKSTADKAELYSIGKRLIEPNGISPEDRAETETKILDTFPEIRLQWQEEEMSWNDSKKNYERLIERRKFFAGLMCRTKKQIEILDNHQSRASEHANRAVFRLLDDTTSPLAAFFRTEQSNLTHAQKADYVLQILKGKLTQTDFSMDQLLSVLTAEALASKPSAPSPALFQPPPQIKPSHEIEKTNCASCCCC